MMYMEAQLPILRSFLQLLVCDQDFASLYPSLFCLLNSSRETLKAAIFEIEGKPKSAIAEFTNAAIAKKENAVKIMTEFCELPGYREFAQLVEQELTR